MGYKGRTSFPPSTSVPFNASDFSGSGAMTWTVQAGDVNGFRYAVQGKRMLLTFDIVTSTIGGVVANAFAQVKIPGGYLPASTIQVPFTYQDSGGPPLSGYCLITQGSNILSFRPTAGANWTVSADTTRISFLQVFEVQ